MNSDLNKLPNINGRYVVLDTETTGVDILTDNLICIAAVEVINGRITGIQFLSYVKARSYKSDQRQMEQNINYFVEDYSDEVYNSEQQTMQNFLRFVGDSIIFAHNAYFDFKFIEKELTRWNLPVIPYERFRCTISIAKMYLTDRGNKTKTTLEDVCTYFKFKYKKDNFHHGYFDAYMLGRIVCKIFALDQSRKETELLHKFFTEREKQSVPKESNKILTDISTIIGDIDNLNVTTYDDSVFEIEEMIKLNPSTSIPTDKLKTLMKTYLNKSINSKK